MKRWGNAQILTEPNLGVEFLMNKVNQTMKKRFDDRKIRLHDTSNFYSNEQLMGMKFDQQAYLSTMKQSRWHGPYVYRDHDTF